MTEADFLRHERCDDCGSSDGKAVYSDGHTYCFVCSTWKKGDDDTEPDSEGTEGASPETDRGQASAISIKGEVRPLPSRKIHEETCKHWGYRVGEHNGKPAQFAYYYDPVTRKPIACKVRFPNKEFTFLGDKKNVGLYGQHLWRDGGKMVVVTEGEIDALTVSQLQQNKWPVVSVPNGAQGATKSIKKALDWLEKFETVVFMFDMDEPGQKAAKECAELLTPGKAKIARLPEGFKDPNDCLKAGRGPDVIKAMWDAPVYRPDGIVAGSEITKEALKEAIAVGYMLDMPKLDEMLNGIRERELTLLTAGSGIGKSTFAREIAYLLHQKYGLTIGNVYLEESCAKTAQGYVAIHNNIPLGKLRQNPELLSDEQWDQSLKEVIHDRMYFYDHFGSLESDHLLQKLRYMRQSLGCNFIILDHISIVISGQTSSSEGERRDIDILMTKLRQLVEATGVGIIAIVHLKQPEGKGKAHEEGGRVTLSQLRGSGALKQLSDNVIALERNQQGSNKDISQVRLLKCREFGDTGVADALKYNRETGRLTVSVTDFDAEEDQSDNEQEF